MNLKIEKKSFKILQKNMQKCCQHFLCIIKAMKFAFQETTTN